MSYAEVFEKMDKNKDGKISWDEFSQGIRVFSPSVTSEEIDKMFREVDLDGDGQIDFTEFAKCFVIDKDEKEDVLKNSFDLYDIDGDGKISASEIHIVLKRLGEKCSMEECFNMVQAVDADKDGFVSFEEFKTLMSSNNSTKLQ